MIIYKITNKINEKVYIGQTVKTARHRFNYHFRNKNLNGISGALTKYGKDNFILETIDIANSKDELDKKEIYWIKYYNTLNKNKGYNLIEGGGKYNENHEYKLGSKHSEETRKKIRENGIKGRLKYHNGKDIIFLKKNEIIPKGFIPGELPKKAEKASNTMKKKRSYFNPETNEYIRIEGNAPSGFIQGRGEFNNIGSKGMKWFTNGIEQMLCLEEKKPTGFFEGTLKTTFFNVFNEKHEFIECIPGKIINDKYTTTMRKTSKEKPIGSNKTYLGRLSEKTKKYIGWYIELKEKND